jgi:hypothetical protein
LPESRIKWSSERNCFLVDGHSNLVSAGPVEHDFNFCTDLVGSVTCGDVGKALEECRASWPSDSLWLNHATDVNFFYRPANGEEERRESGYSCDNGEILGVLSFDEEFKFHNAFDVLNPATLNVDEVLAIANPLLSARGVELLSVKVRGGGQDRWLDVTLRFPPHMSLMEAGRIILTLREVLGNVRADPRTVLGVYTLLVSGNADALLGQVESTVLDAKEKGYNVQIDSQRHEFALDLAAFANSRTGGVIALGVGTKKDEFGRDVISSIVGCKLDGKVIERYLAVAKEKVFPPIEDLVIEVAPCDDGHLLVIYIPSQAEEVKPFMVKGGIIDGGRISGSAFTIPQRRSDQKWAMGVEAVHSLLAAALRARDAKR